MFRELTRKDKQLSHEECIALLQAEKRGVLSVMGDEDYPYGMPMNYHYNPENGILYFHCGKVGHRMDALKKSNKVSFCVYDSGSVENGGWALTVNSVIVFGTMTWSEDTDEISTIMKDFSQKFTSDQAYIQKEIALYQASTLLLKLTPRHICGKRVLEA